MANNDRFGLNQRDIKSIYAVFGKYPEVEKIYIFGSRAKGTNDKGSDIDLAIMNEGVDDFKILKIKADFEESSLPYFVDLINYPTLNHKKLKNHILRVGKTLYTKINNPIQQS